MVLRIVDQNDWEFVSSKESKKNVFILGAGFSKPFDFPLASELFSYLYERELPSFLHGQIPEFCRLISLFHPQISKTENFDEVGHELIVLEKKNKESQFEVILTKLDAWLQLSKLLNRDEDYNVKNLKNFLLRWVTYHFDLHIKKCVHHGKWKVVQSFVKHFQSDSWFMTLNYDNLLEKAFYSLESIKYEMLPISKIHGSIDWWKVEKQIEPGFPNLFETLYSNDEYKILRVKTLEYETESSDMGSSNAFDCPHIVPLTFFKSYESPIIKAQLLKTVKMLRDAENVYIIGCAITSSEFVLKELLRFSDYRRLQSGKKIKWHIVSPDAEKSKKVLENELGIKEVFCHNEKWEEWFEKIQI